MLNLHAPIPSAEHIVDITYRKATVSNDAPQAAIMDTVIFDKATLIEYWHTISLNFRHSGMTCRFQIQQL